MQLQLHPLCVRCQAEGVMITATVVNHRVPHRGDWTLFSEGELESVCKPHHDQTIQREEHHGYSDRVDEDGYPVDPQHPFNKPMHATQKPKDGPPRSGDG